ncbi:hypothetical protein GOBAR_DD35744 [Gossypium barbadense]|nr:hypothetical protein GOBAR_DD35744 [Gossypium barbadense]
MVGERKEQRTRAYHNRLARELRGEKSHWDLVEPRPSLQSQLTPPSEPLPSKGLGTGVTGSFECGQGLGKAKVPCGRRLGMPKASLNVTGANGQAKLEPIAMHKPPQEIFARYRELGPGVVGYISMGTGLTGRKIFTPATTAGDQPTTVGESCGTTPTPSGGLDAPHLGSEGGTKVPMLLEAPAHPSTKVPMLLEALAHLSDQGADGGRGSRTSKHQGADGARGPRTSEPPSCRCYHVLRHDRGPKVLEALVPKGEGPGQLAASFSICQDGSPERRQIDHRSTAGMDRQSTTGNLTGGGGHRRSGMRWAWAVPWTTPARSISLPP